MQITIYTTNVKYIIKIINIVIAEREARQPIPVALSLAYLCLYVCMYVCMYVCLYVLINMYIYIYIYIYMLYINHGYAVYSAYIRPENRGQRKFAVHMPRAEGSGHMRCKLLMTEV